MNTFSNKTLKLAPFGYTGLVTNIYTYEKIFLQYNFGLYLVYKYKSDHRSLQINDFNFSSLKFQQL